MSGMVGVSFFTLTTLFFEILAGLVASVSGWYAYNVARTYRIFTAKGWKEILAGMMFIILHFLLDAVDTIIYEVERKPKTVYRLIDNMEAMSFLIGVLLVLIGITRFSFYLKELWNDPNVVA